MTAVKPPRLKKGDLIGLVSPASAPTAAEKIQGAVRYLESRGYTVKVGKSAAKTHGYLAGTDQERAEDFNAMIADPQVKAIFALRGGYGTPRLLPLINFRLLARQPKIISGFSDITALQLAIFKKCRLVTFSGPMPSVEFWKNPDPFTEEHFWRLLTSRTAVGTLTNPQNDPLFIHREGNAAGVVLGGNLALVISWLATPYMPSLRNAVIVLEEVDEYPHRVDRMFAQLRNAGVLENAAAVVFGRFTECGPKDPAQPHLTVELLHKEYAQFARGPVLGNFCYGHVPKKLTVPFGLNARIDTRKRRIEVRESAVS